MLQQRGVLDPKGSASEQRGGERDGKGNADPWLEFWFPVVGSLCGDPRGSLGQQSSSLRALAHLKLRPRLG